MVQHFPECVDKSMGVPWSSDNIVFQMSDLSVPVLSDSGLASVFLAALRNQSRAFAV